MNISSFFNIKPTNIPQKTSFASYPAFKGGLKQDTVTFTSNQRPTFDSKAAAIKHYKEVAKEVNVSLDEEDELTAFEILGYDVESDFETDEITINGDYKPYFEVFIGKSQISKQLISYEEVGIDEEKLLQNVKEVAGKKFVSPHFIPGEDYVIDTTIVYDYDVAARLTELLQKRCNEAKTALSKKDSATALKALGYNISEDENGKITINGNYSSLLLRKEQSIKNLTDYGIDENALLKDVVEIKGDAQFLAGFKPDHYIKTGNVSTINESGRVYAGNDVKMFFEELSPEFQKTVSDIRTALENGDNLKALQILGYNATADENGKITIEGDYKSGIKPREAYETHHMYDPVFDLEANGIDEERLLQNVVKITGDFNIISSTMKKVSPDLTVLGQTFPYPKKEGELFGDLSTGKDIADLYDLPAAVIDTFARQGVIIPSYKTDMHCYFSGLSDENKKFLDDLSEKRDTILTTKELQDKYGVGETSIRNSLDDKTLTPYRVQPEGYRYSCNPSLYMFDISDPKNEAAIKKFKTRGKKSPDEPRRASNRSSISWQAFNEACERNVIKTNLDPKVFRAGDLERLGYGTKADLIANCMLRTNAFEIKKYILEHDTYDISNATMLDIISTAVNHNPAIVNLQDLQKYSGDAKEDLRKGVVSDKLSLMHQTPHYLINSAIYYVNLADKKNLEFLRSLGGEDFQTWLSGRMDAYAEYRAENNRKLEEFKAIDKPPTQRERTIETQREFDALQEQRKAAARERQELAKQKQDKLSRNTSLKNAIAWVLCPETKRVRRENMTYHISEIFKKNKQAEKIHDELMKGEITLEEAEEMLKKLNLSAKDEIAVYSYYKTCWDISGSEEWREALAAAKPLVEAYNTHGLDGISDPAIKERLIRWEKEKGITEE